jgi:hypothetical protein
MLLIVYLAFFLLKNQQDGLEVMHLLLKDSVIGRKLMMVRIVLFCSTWKMSHVHLIIMMLSVVTI